MSARIIARQFGVGRFFLEHVLRPVQKLWDLRFPNHDVTVEIDGFMLKVFSPRKNRVGRAIYKDRVWEPTLTSMVEFKTKPGMIALDIGADIGYYTVKLSRLVGPEGRVIAFEPIPEARQRLEHNIAINDCKNTTVLEYALGSQESVAILEDPLDTSRINLHKTEPGSRDIKVSIKRLDDLVKEFERTSIDIVKIDVEGAEHEVLRGMEQTLRQWHPVLFVEVHNSMLPLFGSSRGELLRWLSDIGYELKRIDDDETNGSLTNTFCCQLASWDLRAKSISNT